jgi:hypothetical protein
MMRRAHHARTPFVAYETCDDINNQRHHKQLAEQSQRSDGARRAHLKVLGLTI